MGQSFYNTTKNPRAKLCGSTWESEGTCRRNCQFHRTMIGARAARNASGQVYRAGWQGTWTYRRSSSSPKRVGRISSAISLTRSPFLEDFLVYLDTCLNAFGRRRTTKTGVLPCCSNRAQRRVLLRHKMRLTFSIVPTKTFLLTLHL